MNTIQRHALSTRGNVRAFALALIVLLPRGAAHARDGQLSVVRGQLSLLHKLAAGVEA